ncbi:MAG: phosphoesterase [Bacteroidetes bacterium CG_4_9_14_3_um_filter_41_19]|nr:MAG: phosphoesterase [Bacteroidetes bacterium CG_4_9_14_3_um_filter_41_19]
MKQIIALLTPLWCVIIVYQAATCTLISLFEPSYLYHLDFLIPRVIIMVYLAFRLTTKSAFFLKLNALADAVLAYLLLGFFYTETAFLNTLVFSKIDPVLAGIDQWLFGHQPAIRFSEVYGNSLFSELMFFGYFSYYLMPLIALVVIPAWPAGRRINKPAQFNRFVFLLISAYFTYYLLFILFPAAGPQYYYEPPFNQISALGPMAYLVKFVQQVGEAPTGAFPSSHVGITFILLYLLFALNKKLFWIYIPFSILLLFSTVYIKAHYVVDVLAGLLSAPIVLSLNLFIYKKLNFHPNPAVHGTNHSRS